VKGPSIGLRLALWYFLIFALAQSIFGAGIWLALRHNLYRITDDALRDQIDDLTHFFQAQKRNASVAKLQEEVSEAYVLEHSGDYLQIYDGDGEWIYRAAFLQQHPIAPLEPGSVNRISFEDRQLAGQSFRFVTQKIQVNGRTHTVQAGLPNDQVIRTLSLLRRCLLMFAPLLFLAAAGGGYWLSRRALAPVDALTRTAQAISGNNLSARLESLNTGDELQRLADTLNQMLARIESAFSRVTQFTADASHELRTPISLIRTEAEVALRRSRAQSGYQEALRHILLEAERTTSLIEELLSLARADSGRETLDFQIVDLCETVRELLPGWQQVAAVRRLHFIDNLSAQDLRVQGDPFALRRVVNILLDNAFKYTDSPGEVHLSLAERAGKAILSVRDTGIGIAPEDQQKIFERFYRVDKARSRELGGAGLGLAIAQWIVLQHRGSIEVESEPGKGSMFHLELPLIAGTQEPKHLHLKAELGNVRATDST
jgi:heavy metal sensor kinase